LTATGCFRLIRKPIRGLEAERTRGFADAWGYSAGGRERLFNNCERNAASPQEAAVGFSCPASGLGWQSSLDEFDAVLQGK
jgi:hypothetical protein